MRLWPGCGCCESTSSSSTEVVCDCCTVLPTEWEITLSGIVTGVACFPLADCDVYNDTYVVPSVGPCLWQETFTGYTIFDCMESVLWNVSISKPQVGGKCLLQVGLYSNTGELVGYYEKDLGSTPIDCSAINETISANCGGLCSDSQCNASSSQIVIVAVP